MSKKKKKSREKRLEGKRLKMVVTFLCAAGLGPNCPQQTCLTFILREEIMNNLQLHIDSLRKDDTCGHLEEWHLPLSTSMLNAGPRQAKASDWVSLGHMAVPIPWSRTQVCDWPSPWGGAVFLRKLFR
jgi:hypothetical protein